MSTHYSDTIYYSGNVSFVVEGESSSPYYGGGFTIRRTVNEAIASIKKYKLKLVVIRTKDRYGGPQVLYRYENTK